MSKIDTLVVALLALAVANMIVNSMFRNPLAVPKIKSMNLLL